jgi:hypothetical protein
MFIAASRTRYIWWIWEPTPDDDDEDDDGYGLIAKNRFASASVATPS